MPALHMPQNILVVDILDIEKMASRSLQKPHQLLRGHLVNAGTFAWSFGKLSKLRKVRNMRNIDMKK
jgi:hypothetical protein